MRPPQIAEGEAREALERWVRRTVWRRRGLATSLEISRFEETGAFHVRLETFIEQRNVQPATRPHAGGAVDGAEGGRPPGPWEMRIEQGALFTDRRQSYVVPHTEEVRSCYACGGDGRVSCSRCGGDGKVTCSSCGGDGRIERTRTRHVHSGGQTRVETERYTESCSCFMGKVSCMNCGGDGRVTCSTCAGEGRLVHFQRLDVVWTNHVNDRVLEDTDLPDPLVLGAGGTEALREEEARLEPVAHVPGGAFRGVAPRVNDAVNHAVNALLAAAPVAGALLHRQRLAVRAVPVCEAEYCWGDKRRRFWVYGTERHVHAPGFPLSITRIGGLVGGALAVGVIAAVIAIDPFSPATDTTIAEPEVRFEAPAAPRP